MNSRGRRTAIAAATLAIATGAVILADRTTAGPAEDGAPLAHMVFFTLADRSEEDRAKLVAGCEEHLSGHDGTLHFSVGTRAEAMDREVNVTDYDVALHLIFEDQDAHDTYQTHPRHLRFIDENKDLWTTVRVFDSFLTPETAPGAR